MRKLLAFVAGLVAGGLTIGLLEWAGHLLVPPGPLDPRSRVPVDPPSTAALLLVLVAWAAGAFVAGWVATRVGGTLGHGLALAVGSFLMGGGLMNLIAIPSPAWFWVLGLLCFLPLALAGWRTARR